MKVQILFPLTHMPPIHYGMQCCARASVRRNVGVAEQRLATPNEMQAPPNCRRDGTAECCGGRSANSRTQLLQPLFEACITETSAVDEIDRRLPDADTGSYLSWGGRYWQRDVVSDGRGKGRRKTGGSTGGRQHQPSDADRVEEGHPGSA
jgi:hypothetical protein